MSFSIAEAPALPALLLLYYCFTIYMSNKSNTSVHCHSAFAFAFLFIYFMRFVPSFFGFFASGFVVFFFVLLCNVIQHLAYLVTEGRPAMNFTFFQKVVEGAAAGSYEERLSCHAVIVGRLFRLVYLRGSANVISKSSLSLSVSLCLSHSLTHSHSTSSLSYCLPAGFSQSHSLTLSLYIYNYIPISVPAGFSRSH